jgi:hypothetical protein
MVALFGLLLAGTLGAREPSVQVGNGVLVPPSGDWQQELSPDGTAVRFTRVYKWLGQPKGMTQMLVFADSAAPDAGDDAEAIAAQRFADEERIMREQGVAAGEYRLEDVTRGTRVVDGRTLFTMTYHKDLAVMRFGRKTEKARLLLWFPDSFPADRDFYGFLVSEIREKGAMVEEPDLARIDPIIRSFRIQEQIEPH